MLEFADEFIEDVLRFSCMLAKHRKSNALETKDVQLYLERQWNISLPGFQQGLNPIHKRPKITESHKQRLTLIQKSIQDARKNQDK